MPIYDVENRFSYYKSYSDNIMSGSALPTLGSSTWDRGVIGSVVSGSEEWRASTVWSDYLFKKETPFFRSGEVRYLRLSSNSQTIKDSYVPDIQSIYLASGGSLVSSSLKGIGLFFSTNGNSLTGSDGLNVSSNTWVFDTPFEKKYSNIQPDAFQPNGQITVSTKYELWQIIPQKTNIFFSASSGLVRTSIDKQNLFLANVTLPISNSFNLYLDFDYNNRGYSNPDGSWNYGADYYGYNGDIKKSYSFVFGINKSVFFESGYGSSPGSLNNNYFQKNTSGIAIQGWKYGLYNGLPTNFSAVFRQNHYGQFRDMLEQRIYTATYNNPQIGGPMDANGGIKFISGSSLAGESNNLLTASIYEANNVTEAYRVNPYGSGIFDKEYRASQPWHADDTRLKYEFPRRVEV